MAEERSCALRPAPLVVWSHAAEAFAKTETVQTEQLPGDLERLISFRFTLLPHC